MQNNKENSQLDLIVYPKQTEKSYINYQDFMKYSLFVNSKGKEKATELVHNLPNGLELHIINLGGVPQARARDVFNYVMTNGRKMLHDNVFKLSLREMREKLGILKNQHVKSYADQISHTLIELRKNKQQVEKGDIPDFEQLHIWTAKKEGDELIIFFDQRFLDLYKKHVLNFKALPLETYLKLNSSLAKYCYEMLHVWFDGDNKTEFSIGLRKFLNNAGLGHYLKYPRYEMNRLLKNNVWTSLNELVDLGEFIWNLDPKTDNLIFRRQYKHQRELTRNPVDS